LLYDVQTEIRPAEVRELSPDAPLVLAGEGLWAVLISSGSCGAGEAPQRTAGPGMLVLGRGALALNPAPACHLLAVRLAGRAAADFAAALPAPVYLARGESCPGAAEWMSRLAQSDDSAGEAALSRAAFALLCELAGADADAEPLPPLVAEAVADIRENYAGLYGVEELSERLGVSKSHLVRSFHAAMGVSPGKYLTGIRLEAARRLLLHREYSLDVIASLCGFSGANYLCRVFKKELGVSPAAWRAAALESRAAPQSAASALESGLYV
jgi:AraC-like DNA-binding protein